MPIQHRTRDLLVATLTDDPDFTRDLSAVREIWPPCDVVIDLTAVKGLNSANLSLLIGFRSQQNIHHRRTWLCGISAAVSTLFQLTGLNHLFHVCTTVDEAVAAIEAAGKQKGTS